MEPGTDIVDYTSNVNNTSDENDLVFDFLKKYLKPGDDPEPLKQKLEQLGIITLADILVLPNLVTEFDSILTPVACYKLLAELKRELSREETENNIDSVRGLADLNFDMIINDYILKELKGNTFLDKDVRLELVRVLGKTLQSHFSDVTSDICRRLAYILCTKYPAALGHPTNKVLVLDLAGQLENQKKYLKRKDKRRNIVPILPDHGEEPKKRFCKSQNYGINPENDLPNQLPEGETPFTQETKRQKLLEMHYTGEINKQKMMALMKETYPAQRATIALQINMEQLLQEWPFIGNYAVFRHHFYKLMDITEESVLQRIENIAPKLIRFFISEGEKKRKGSAKEKPTIIRKIIQKYHEHDKMNEQSSLELICIIRCLCEKFDLDSKEFFLYFEETASFDHVQNSDLLPDHGKPVVAVLGKELMENPRCFVVVEKRCMAPTTLKPIHAVLQAFMAYFVFKISYPENLGPLFQFLQISIFGILEEKGSKVERTKNAKGNWKPSPKSVCGKYSSFCREFDGYCSKWGL